jgi:hypothetical protein
MHMELSRRRPESCLSDLVLDGLVAGEARAERVATHLATCDVCTARLHELERDRDASALVVEKLLARAQSAPFSAALRTRRRWLTAALPLFAAAAAALVFVLLPRPPREREKGNAATLALDVVVKHADGHVEPLADSGHVKPGDMVRFLVSTARPGHLVILGLDAAGKVSVYVSDGDAPKQIDRGQRQVMPGSIILDETRGPERLVALQCDARFSVGSAVDAGTRALERAARDPRRAGALGLPGCNESTLVMVKQ